VDLRAAVAGFRDGVFFAASRVRATADFFVAAFPEAAGRPGFLIAAFLAEPFAAVPLTARAVFRTAAFTARGLAFAATLRADFTPGERDVFACPRAFAAAFIFGRRVGLLREVEAMGTTLGTVET
jgi:hypothetical protein